MIYVQKFINPRYGISYVYIHICVGFDPSVCLSPRILRALKKTFKTNGVLIKEPGLPMVVGV